MTQEWINTQNGIATMQSIARNLEKLTEEKITPRDLFAAAALCGQIATGEDVMTHEQTALFCFEAADAMMKVRDK